ncbi:MAG: hypothetical protein V2I27_11325 [Erythrobacter sp.]|jgi:hypothetical protein|nr:hypothetical protein [Erythrobacter sp.]
MNKVVGRHRRSRAGIAQVFAIPAALLVASIAGLVAGLTGDGWADALAWTLLSLPLLAAAIAFARRG